MTAQTTPPAVVPAANWSFPRAHQTRLDSGLRVLAYHCPGQFVVAASLYFDVPLNAEPRAKEGVAALTGRCLTRGAAGRSADEFADALALCGADLEASASPDGFALRLAVPETHLPTGLRLMADAVTSPVLSADEFAHEQRLRLQEIDQARAYPQHVAVERLNAALFGAARAARPVGGDADPVAALTRDDVSAYADAHLQPSNATMVIAGDFADADPVALVDAALGGWRHRGGPVVSAEAPQIAAEPQVVLIDWPDAPQATLRIAGPGITRGDDRWPPMFVANFAVGGNFSSRINTVLREEKGVTYGANSGLDTGRRTGLMTVSTAVRSDAAAASVADIVAIISDARGSITVEEVETAIRAATDSAALGFERADAVVGRVELLLSQNLPLEHVDANLARIREVTVDSANQAYADVARPEAMTVVVVGDAASLLAPLNDLGYAEVQAVSPEPR